MYRRYSKLCFLLPNIRAWECSKQTKFFRNVTKKTTFIYLAWISSTSTIFPYEQVWVLAVRQLKFTSCILLTTWPSLSKTCFCKEKTKAKVKNFTYTPVLAAVKNQTWRYGRHWRWFRTNCGGILTKLTQKKLNWRSGENKSERQRAKSIFLESHWRKMSKTVSDIECKKKES